MTTTNQKQLIQKTMKRKETKHTLIKPAITEESKRGKEQKKTTKTNIKQVAKRQYMPTNNYFECNWTNCSIQKME